MSLGRDPFHPSHTITITMKLRSSLMLGGAAYLLLTAMPVVAQNSNQAPVTSDVVTGGDGGSSADPFAGESYEPFSTKQIRPERAKQVRETMRLRTEVWEVPSIELVRALDAGTSAEMLKGWRGGLLEDGTLALTSILNIDSGYQGSAETITECIYPTEYEPGEILPTADATADATSPAETKTDAPTTSPTTPTAFETRNTGTTSPNRGTGLLAGGRVDCCVGLRSLSRRGTCRG